MSRLDARLLLRDGTRLAAAAMVGLGLVAAARSQPSGAPGSWSAKAPLPVARNEVAAVSFNDRIYVFGGSYPGQKYDVADNGEYDLALQPNQVFDTQLGALPATTVHGLDVDIHYVYPVAVSVDGQPVAAGGAIDFGDTLLNMVGATRAITLTNALDQTLTKLNVDVPLGVTYPTLSPLFRPPSPDPGSPP